MDLSKLSAEDLKKELSRREALKDQDREAYKNLVAETLPKAIMRLANVSEHLSTAKMEVFKYFEDVLELKAKAYGIKEKQQTHSFSSDSHELTIGYRINDGWDDTVNSGIAKVNDFIQSLAKDKETAALVNMVFNLLRKDAKGNLKSSRVLELQKIAKDINNQDFSDGVEIISQAYKPKRSVWFVEATAINSDGTKVPIPLNISAVDFAQGYKFDYYSEELNP